MRLWLKVRTLEAEVIETLLYGCVTWSPNKLDYDRLRQVHHFMHLGYLDLRKRKSDDHTLSYANASAKTNSESIEVTVRNRRTLFAGFVANPGKERLPRTVIFRELIEVKGYTRGGKITRWMACIEDHMAEFGVEFEGCGGRLHRRPADSFDGSRRG